MTHANTLKHLAALLLAGAALIGCGGGDAEPPPPPLGNPPAAPDTTAPTVTIANNVSVPAATGPVTFTFVFSEDVGVSFDGTDITVDGGTAGAFTRIDGRQATLVVAPMPGVPGTMTVRVAAGRFADIAGNTNAAAVSGSKDYVVPPPPPPPPTSGTVLANFDAISPPFLGAEGGEGSAVEAGPAGGSGNALKVLRSGGQPYALAIVTLPSSVPLEAGRLTISARVYSPTAGIPMVIKLEGPGGVNSGDLQANQAVVVGWQTLSWTVPAVNTNYNLIVLLPNLGTVDAPPGKAYYFDDIQLLGAASGGGGGGKLTFSSGLAAGNRTVEGGEFGGFSGSNQDGFNCSGDPAWCGSGGEFTPAVAAADSFFFYYYQTPTPATALYMGIFVLAPGLTGGLSGAADSPGVQINGQTAIKFKLGQNAEWFGTATNKFALDLALGKRYPPNGNTCRLQLRTIVTPTAAAATVYTVPLSAFSVVQDCGVGGLTVASALAASPVSQVSFQGVGGSNALTAGGQTSGANLSVAVGGVYPTTLVVVGGITFE
jgi:hypothetical protein